MASRVALQSPALLKSQHYIMKLKQLNHAPSSPTSVTDVGEDQLRNHLQHALNELPSDLLKYNQGQLLDDLCFLLRSPLLLYAMGPRLRRAKQTAEASRIRMLTPESMSDGIASPESKLELDDGIDTENLNMDIQWDGDSWVTRLMFGNSTLVEGRQRAARKAGFSQSFRWFCDETRFLCYEFGAREQAAAVRLGSAMDTEPLAAPKGVGKAGAVKKSRIVKLKIGPTRVEAGRGARTK